MNNGSQFSQEPDVIDAATGEILASPQHGSLVKYEQVQQGAVPYHKVSEISLSDEQIKTLIAPIDDNDVEIRPDGILYLPEIKYRKTLNRSIAPGKWALVPRQISIMENKSNTDLSIIAYNGDMFVNGCYAANATGEQKYYAANSQMSYATACEGAKSDCMVRCCKDLGIASELWDPVFIERWKHERAVQVWCEHQETHKKKPIWRRNDRKIAYPWKESGAAPADQGGANSDEFPFPNGQNAGKTWAQLDNSMLTWATENCNGSKLEKAKAEIKRRTDLKAAQAPAAPPKAEHPQAPAPPATQKAEPLPMTDDQKKEAKEIEKFESHIDEIIKDSAVWASIPNQRDALKKMFDNAVGFQRKKTAYEKLHNNYESKKVKKAA